jgi:hypothetical protein
MIVLTAHRLNCPTDHQIDNTSPDNLPVYRPPYDFKAFANIGTTWAVEIWELFHTPEGQITYRGRFYSPGDCFQRKIV